MMELLGRLVGIRDLESIDQIEFGFASAWASSYPLVLWLIIAALAAWSVIFYRRYQPSVASARQAIILSAIRALALALLVIMLAEPVVTLGTTERFRPLLVLLFDGSESMQIVDKTVDQDLLDLKPLVS